MVVQKVNLIFWLENFELNCLIFISFSIFSLSRVKTDLLIILLKSSKILAGLRELSLLHTLSNIPVNKSPLGIHKVKLVVKSGPGLGDGSGVGQHADSTSNLSLVSSWNDGRRLVVDSNLEASWTPVNKLDAPLGLDSGDGSVHVLGDNISSIEKAAGHVLAMTRVALHHLVGRLKTGVGDLGNSDLLVICFFSRDDGGIGHKRKVDPWVGHQVSLELSQVNVQSSIKSQGSCDGGDNLSNHPIKVGVGWPLDVEIPAADVIDSLVINHESTVRMLKSGVGGKDSIVRLNNCGGNLRSWVDGKLKLGLLAVINRQTLHEKGGKSRSGASTKRMEKQKSLKASTLISKLPNPVQKQINNFLSNSVVASSIVVSRILFTIDELFRMEKLTISSASCFIYHSWFQVNKDSSGHMFATSSFGEEGLERVIAECLV